MATLHIQSGQVCKEGRKEGRNEGGWKETTVNVGKKVGHEENRRKSFFKEDIPLFFLQINKTIFGKSN